MLFTCQIKAVSIVPLQVRLIPRLKLPLLYVFHPKATCRSNEINRKINYFPHHLMYTPIYRDTS